MPVHIAAGKQRALLAILQMHPDRVLTTLLFTDIVSSTAKGRRRSQER